MKKPESFRDYGKKTRRFRLLLKFQIHPKDGLVSSDLESLVVLDCLVTPSMCKRLFTLLIPQQGILGSRWQPRMENMDLQADGKPCRVQTTWIFVVFCILSFAYRLC